MRAMVAGSTEVDNHASQIATAPDNSGEGGCRRLEIPRVPEGGSRSCRFFRSNGHRRSNPHRLRRENALRADPIGVGDQQRISTARSQSPVLTPRLRDTVSRSYVFTSCYDDPAVLAQATRRHWSIENSLHWVLDVTFREDDSRVRHRTAARNLALLRKIALNLVAADRSSQTGLRGRRKKAAWNDDYMLRIITRQAHA